VRHDVGAVEDAGERLEERGLPDEGERVLVTGHRGA
jgi:hypothetical protein